MKITFLLNNVAHPRYRKRVESLESLGVQSKVLSFERVFFPGKPWSQEYILLGKMDHGNYHKRLLPLANAFFSVRDVAKESDAVYAFGFDVLLLGWMVTKTLRKRVKIVYEVGDIRKIVLGRNIKSRCLRRLEYFLLRDIDVLVSTSEAYIQEYYRSILGSNDFSHIVIENKIDSSQCFRQESRTREGLEKILRIGYFGLIRCRRSWETLKKAANRGNGRILIYVRGIPMSFEQFKRESNQFPHIKYDGPYISPDDLTEIYGSIDIVWAAHHHHVGASHRWCRANRFYEACFFRKPMFVQVGTQDAKVVQEWDIGACIDLADIEKSVNQILEVGQADLARWRENIANIPEEIYSYSNEHEQLLAMIG